jgi:ribosome maturation factor RimP
MGAVHDQLQAIIAPAIEALGFELLGIEYLAQGRHSLLRLYIDSESGIDVDDCATVSHQVSAVLDVEDPIHGEYTLEVSSPGLDRPLFSLEHYQRFLGEMVKLRLHMAVEGRRKFTGLLKAAEGDEICVEVDGEEYHIPIDNIEKANLVPQW